MKHTCLGYFFAICAILISCSPEQKSLDLLPYPQSVEVMDGTFDLPDTLGFKAQMNGSDLLDLKKYLPDYPLPLVEKEAGCLQLIVDEQNDLSPESYSLQIDETGIVITASDASGIFYGLQTLAQLAEDSRELPQLQIKDAPRFGYRGMHLDVSRHFFDVAFIKKQLDALASYKINRFHWHLTDGPGWRLEIPKYPELTQKAAWRPQKLWKEWWDTERHYCNYDTEGAYGGYYTAEDVREVVEYARLRHITVIPEIEMPGHSEEVCAVYPNLSCTGEPYTCADVCIGNEETFTFFQNVLDVVMELFPSTYIHIGGDEAGKEAWKSCSKCQKRMEKEGLKDVNELQSYMISRIEKYLNEHGRQIIGWDEILDGGLAPNATVMSWRGEKGGIAAAHSGHDAIMSPSTHCYLNFYQAEPETQPEAIGGYITLEKSYSYDPAPAELGDSICKHILGVQGNLWSEYIHTDELMEYMIYPRILALAEVGWTNVEQKDWNDFKVRVNHAIKDLQTEGYNPFPLNAYPTVTQHVNAQEKCIEVSMESDRTDVEIRYTLDGTEPTASSKLYKKPIQIKNKKVLKAGLFEDDKSLGDAVTVTVNYHKGIGKTATYAQEASYYIHDERYKAGGDSALVDGFRGGPSYADGRWQGFCPRDMDVTIDLGEATPVHNIQANFMQMVGPWIFFPSKVEVSFSLDGETFIPVGTDTCDVPIDAEGTLFRDFGWEGTAQETRYVRYHAFQSEKRAFIFTDEIVIE